MVLMVRRFVQNWFKWIPDMKLHKIPIKAIHSWRRGLRHPSKYFRNSNASPKFKLSEKIIPSNCRRPQQQKTPWNFHNLSQLPKSGKTDTYLPSQVALCQQRSTPPPSFPCRIDFQAYSQHFTDDDDSSVSVCTCHITTHALDIDKMIRHCREY